MIAAQQDAPSRRDPPYPDPHLHIHAARPGQPGTRWRDTLLWSVVLAGLVSCCAGVVHAVHRSQDFQWSGERMVLHHADPWRDYLMGDPLHGLFATQVPNYLPILYILLVPFGLMSATSANLAWAICNAVFATGAAVLAARFHGLRSWRAQILIVAAVLAAAPTRVSISNGQQGLLILLLWSLALLHSQPITRPRALLAGVSYLKYSFAPSLALFLLLRDGLRRGLRALLWSLLPAAAATLLVWLWISERHDARHLLAFAVEPLAVTRVGYQPTGDPGQTFMDLFEFLLGGGPVATPRLTLASLFVALSINAAVLLLAIRKVNSYGPKTDHDRLLWFAALMATMSFVLYKHHPYDEVVFLFPLCYALRHWRRPAATAALFLIGYCWYVQPLVDLHVAFSLAWCMSRILILFALIFCVYRSADPRQPELRFCW